MKIPCEMIQDLIPSYVEEVCSKVSKKYVEEHLVECRECKELVQLYKEKDFSAQSLEKKQLDGFKKLKKKVTLQNVFIYGLVLLLIGFGIYHFDSYNQVSSMWYYILLVVSMVATYVVTMNQQVREKISKKEKRFLVISLLAIVYEISIYAYSVVTVLNGSVPFGLEAQKVGSLLHGQERILFFLHIGIFGYSFYEFIKKNIVFYLLLHSNLIGIFLILVHTSLLGILSEITAWLHSFMKSTSIIVVIGVIWLFFQYIIKKREKKS